MIISDPHKYLYHKKGYFYKKIFMKGLPSKYKYQILLIVIGIAWIAVLNELLQVIGQNMIYPDSDNYRESASYFYHSFKAHYYRPIGMALIFGLPYLFGAGDAAIYEFSFIVNLLAWLGSALLLFSLLKRFVSQKLAFVLALVFLSIPGIALNNFHLLTESTYIFLGLLSFYFVDRYYRTKVFRYLSLAIAVMIFTILIKPGTMFFAIVVAVFFSRALLKNFRRQSAFFMYFSLGLLVFHCIKMKQEYGNFTVSYIDSVTFYNYLGSKAMALKTNDTINHSINARAEYILNLPYPEQKAVGSADMMNQAKTNTSNLARAYLSDIIHNSTSFSDCITICRNLEGTGYFEFAKLSLIRISKFQNIFFSAIGFLLAAYYCLRSLKKPDTFTLASLYILYTIAISGVSYYQGDRFHIVFFPFVILLMGRFYAEKFNRFTLLHRT